MVQGLKFQAEPCERRRNSESMVEVAAHQEKAMDKVIEGITC